MLASLITNFYGGQGAEVIILQGATVRVITTAPEAVLYLSDEWATPQGRAGTSTLELVVDKDGLAAPFRERTQPVAARSLVVETQWHVSVETGSATLQLQAHCPCPEFGQEIQITGTSLTLTANTPAASGEWHVSIAPGRASVEAIRRQIEASAGGTVTFDRGGAVVAIGSAPVAHGIKNPSPAEIIAMVQAARSGRIVRQFAR